MILATEITKWDEGTACNHTYIMTESMDKIFGYFKRNNAKDFMMFKNPIHIDTRYRKFKIIQRGLKMKGDDQPLNKSWLVKGSNGHEYHVEQTPTGMTCSCIGYKYHGKCKHIDGIQK